MITNEVMDNIFNNHGRKISQWNDDVLSPHLLQAGGRERFCCFPLFAHDQLITTSVTSHSNGSKLGLAWLI